MARPALKPNSFYRRVKEREELKRKDLGKAEAKELKKPVGGQE